MDTRYTHGHAGVVVANHATRSVADSAAFLLRHIDPTMRLLDVGCGPGSITIELAGLVREAHGVDAASAAVAAAEAAARTRDVPVRFDVADVHDLPYDDAAFDVVYAHQLLQHLGDPVAALREIGRVIRPGGIVAVRDADYGTMTHAPHDPRIDRWLDLYHSLTAHHGAEADAGRHLPAWVAAAGFVDPVVTTSTWTYTTPDEVAGWRDLWVGRLTEARMGEDLLSLGLIDVDERDDLVAAWQAWGASPQPFFAFMHGEVVARRPV